MIDLRHIRYFKTVAEELHFRRAAEKLHVSQPPLSMQIRQLEDFLGVKLLTRSSRRVELTRAGEHFYKKSLLLLKDMDAMVRETRHVGAGKAGSLRLGFVSSSAAGVFQKALASYAREYPDVTVDIRQLTNSEILDAFENDKVDVAFCRLPLSVPDYLRLHVLLKEDYLLAFPEGMNRRKTRDILSGPLVIFPREKAPEMYEDIMDIFRKNRVTPAVSYEAAEQLTLLGMVSSGLGFAIVPRAASFARLPGVAYRPLPGKSRSGLGLVCGKTDNPLVKGFVDNAVANKAVFMQAP